MAEFCKECADKLGVRPDEMPVFCENCKAYFDFSPKLKIVTFFILTFLLLLAIIIN